MKQRIIIPNNNTPNLGALSVQNYDNYPAILNNKITLNVNNNAKIKIHDLFPKTLNSNVNINSSSHNGEVARKFKNIHLDLQQII